MPYCNTNCSLTVCYIKEYDDDDDDDDGLYHNVQGAPKSVQTPTATSNSQ